MKRLIRFSIVFWIFFTTTCALCQRKIDAQTLLAHVRVLAADSLEGRKTGTVGNRNAGNYLVRLFEEMGLKTLGQSYRHEFTFKRKRVENGVYSTGSNIIGYIPGTKNPDRYFVISAHYDHVGIKNGEIYNGADDNASGVAVLLETARYFKLHPPDNSLIFAAFDAEESGLQGSRAFIAAPPVPLNQIALNINLDMLSRSERNELYVCGTSHYPHLKPIIANTASRAKVKVLFGHDTPDRGAGDDWTLSSDHGSFHLAKIPFIYFGVEDHIDYHKPTDDFERIQQHFFLNVAEFVLEAVQVLDQQF